MTQEISGTKTMWLSEGQKDGSFKLINKTDVTVTNYKLLVNSDDFVQPDFTWLNIRKTKNAEGKALDELINGAENPSGTEKYESEFHSLIPAGPKQIRPDEEFEIIFKLDKGADEPAYIQIDLSTTVTVEDETHRTWISGGDKPDKPDETKAGGVVMNWKLKHEKFQIRRAAILSAAFCLLCAPATVLAQTQLGADIDGEAAGDSSGSVSLSSDGNRLAIGAPGNDANGTDSGHVRVYEWSGSTWTQFGADIDGEAANDNSGESVSLSSDGNRLAIGAPGNDANGTDSGHARVYEWAGSTWVQLGADIDGEATGDGSGLSVSLSSEGNRLAIGTPWNAGNGANSGHVRVYQWSGTTWVQLGADIDSEAAADYSGFSVSLSSDGNRLAIGAIWNRNYYGHTRVYQWSGTAWVQLGADIDGERAGDHSGWSVSLSSDGNRLAIGANQNDGNGSESGHARVYQWSGTAWTQLGADIDGEAANDHSGAVSLSSDGNRLAIGAPWNDGNGNESGQVRVYEWSDMAWTQIGADIDGEAARDFSGAVSLSSDGNRLANGAGSNDGNGDVSGHVRVYDLSMFNVFKINAGHAGAWFNPDTSGQGQLIDVEPVTQFMFLAWFTFTAAASSNPDQQHWYTAQGNYSGNKAELMLYETLGGQFDGPQETSTNPVGEVTVSFTDCEQGQMVYSIDTDGRQGTIPLQRLIPGSGNVCEEESGKVAISTQAMDINAGMDGAWANHDTLGQGFLIDAHPNPDGSNFIFVAWFTYGDHTASGQRWLTAQGDFAGSKAEIDVYETTGGQFDDPQAVDTLQVGTMSIDFTDCSNAQLGYSLTDEGAEGGMTVSRLIPGGQALCEELSGVN